MITSIHFGLPGPILAESQFAAPEQIAAWLASAAFFIWFCLLVKKAVMELRGNEAHPPNPQLGQSIKEINRRVESLERWREQLITKLEADKMEVIQAGEQRASRIHEHIEKDRVEMERKIETLPERIFAMLKNTGAI